MATLGAAPPGEGSTARAAGAALSSSKKPAIRSCEATAVSDCAIVASAGETASRVAAVSVQLLAGVANVLLLAPIWLQLVHLLLADLLWVTLVLLVAALLDAEALPAREPYAPSAAPTMAAPIGMRSLPKGPG